MFDYFPPSTSIPSRLYGFLRLHLERSDFNIILISHAVSKELCFPSINGLILTSRFVPFLTNLTTFPSINGLILTITLTKLERMTLFLSNHQWSDFNMKYMIKEIYKIHKFPSINGLILTYRKFIKTTI